MCPSTPHHVEVNDFGFPFKITLALCLRFAGRRLRCDQGLSLVRRMAIGARIYPTEMLGANPYCLRPIHYHYLFTKLQINTLKKKEKKRGLTLIQLVFID